LPAEGGVAAEGTSVPAEEPAASIGVSGSARTSVVFTPGERPPAGAWLASTDRHAESTESSSEGRHAGKTEPLVTSRGEGERPR
jgi:hypothetical protein